MGAALKTWVWLALLALLTLTVGLSFLPLGPFRLAVSLLIACAKTALIGWIYMELRRATGLVRLAALAALVLLAVLIVLVSADAAARR
jgi:cytochrome c oxidase subunit 4